MASVNEAGKQNLGLDIINYRVVIIVILNDL